MKYLLSSKKNGDLALFEYSESNILKSIVILNDGLQENQVKFLLASCVKKDDLSMLLGLIYTKDTTAFIEEISIDLSFERFWLEYDHKVGKKERVKKKWEAMPDEEKAKALKHIKKYNFFLAQNPTIAKKYPETYLNTAEWNN